ncbi:MAG: GNAT family N-acetyltransferase [Ferruginibacter sp.]
MGNTGNGYEIVKGIADDKELENYRMCFVRNGSPRDITNLQWLHQQNLANTHTIYYAMQDEMVAAIYTAMPVIFTINGVKNNALQSIDTITDEAHRGKGLFPRLANKLYDDAAESGFELVYGFPNENSAPGFFKKLKWVSFGEAPFLLKPVSIKYFINKFLNKGRNITFENEQHLYSLPGQKEVGKNISIREINSFEENYDQLWQKISGVIKVAVDRSAAYMNWRYIKKPGEVYSKCGIFIGGELKGIMVFTIKNKHSGRIGYIMELIYNDTSHEAGELLLKYASQIFKKEKTDAALAWCFPHSFNYKSFRRSGYFNLPVRFRPQHLFLGVRAFNESNKNLTEDWNNWYISYSDSDTV